MNIQYLHVDTLNQPYSDANTSTYLIIPSNPKFCKNSFNINIPIPNPLINVKKIYLKSFECPILFPNVRQATNTFSIKVGEIVKSVYLNYKNYSNILLLVNDLNAYYAFSFASDNFIFSINSSTGFLQINSSTNINFSVEKTNLSSMLGFSDLNTYTNNNLFAVFPFNLSMDTFINMHIDNLKTGNSTTINGVSCSFKIPINAYGGSIQFSGENLSYSQFVSINSNSPISNLSIVIYDRWGFAIHSNHADWSATFALEF